jgi:hypothetical protein
MVGTAMRKKIKISEALNAYEESYYVKPRLSGRKVKIFETHLARALNDPEDL